MIQIFTRSDYLIKFSGKDISFNLGQFSQYKNFSVNFSQRICLINKFCEKFDSHNLASFDALCFSNFSKSAFS